MLAHPVRNLVIDARPRGPNGPLAREPLLGRPILGHLMQLAAQSGQETVAVHARLDEHDALRSVLPLGDSRRIQFLTGPPPEHAMILRADRLYDPARLRRALEGGRDPESAVIWRLDRPSGLTGAEDELVRRQTYQPLGRFWALGPARALARWLRPTMVRPNAITWAAGGLMMASAALVASGGAGWSSRGLTAIALALALILDTADGHLARLQGTASEFGRWLDANLDEWGDMALHASVAWSAFGRDANPAWLLLGMIYPMGKYLFVIGSHTGVVLEAAAAAPAPAAGSLRAGLVRRAVITLGHADVRWHLWIVLALAGRLEIALVGYAVYFPARALAGMGRKVALHAR